MAILPIDLQAILLRMDSVSKTQHRQQEGVIAAQIQKGVEMAEITQIESNRVNELKPHPDENTKIDDKEKEKKTGSEEKKNRETSGKSRKKISVIPIKETL
jgi:hypothetical protein